MSEEINQSLGLEKNSKNMSSSESSGDIYPELFFSIIFYLLAAILVISGLVVAYQDSNYVNEIVGGDAYNYIIFAGRGITWAVASITSALFGLGCQVLYLYRKLKNNIF